MKKYILPGMLVFLMLSCSKQDGQNKTSGIPKKGETELSGGLTTDNQNPDTCCAIPLQETSPGIFETTQNYFGNHLTFNSLEIRGGYPYAKLINARPFGSPAGGNNYYNIVVEGIQENGIPQRNFAFQMTSCLSVVQKQKDEITMAEFYGQVPENHTTFTNGVAQANPWNLGSAYDTAMLFDVNYEPNKVIYTRLKMYGTFANCSMVTLVSGKIIARYRPNTSNPRVYDYYVVPVKNKNEDRVFQVSAPE